MGCWPSIENNNNIGVRCALAAKPYGGGKRVDGEIIGRE